MYGIQIIIVLIVAFALARVYARFRQGHLSLRRFLAWAALWLGVMAAGLVPRLSDAASRWLGVERGATLLTFLAIVLLFYMVFVLYVRLERQQRELTELVRKLALREDQDNQPRP
jgi:hypothetical protein